MNAKLSCYEHIHIGRFSNLHWCTFNKSDSLSNLIIIIRSFIFSSKIINVVIPDSNIFLWIAASVADAAAVNPNGNKALLANGLSTFPIKGNPVFNTGPKLYHASKLVY